MRVQKNDLLSKLDLSMQDAVSGIVRVHHELGRAVAGSTKAATFGRGDEIVDRVQRAESEAFAQLGEGVKRATSATFETLHSVVGRFGKRKS